jgi:hypothetical protein
LNAIARLGQFCSNLLADEFGSDETRYDRTIQVD